MSRENGPISVQLKALLAAWVTMIFGTSALLFLVSSLNFKIYSSNKLLNFFNTTWEIADEVGPVVKISIIVVFALLVTAREKFTRHPTTNAYWINALLAVIANVVVLGFLPQAYSRGFGIGLSGTRFDRQTLYIYLVGAVLGGLVYTYFLQKQRTQLRSRA